MSQQPPPYQPFVPPPPPYSNSPYPPDVMEQKARQVATDANQALIFSIVGLFCCGFIFGFIAFRKANEALETIAIYEVGENMRTQATIAKVLAVIDMAVWILLLIVRVLLIAAR